MVSNWEQQTETKDIKAIARPQAAYSESSTENGPSTPAKPSAKKAPSFPEKLDRATNSLGEVLKADDLIVVKDLKGRPTTAKIKYFYPEPRGTMAVYAPAEDQEAGWSWFRGCCLIDTLSRA